MNPCLIESAHALRSPPHHQAFSMSHMHAHERAYAERSLDSQIEAGLFDGSRWGNQCRLRAQMKTKARREARHRQHNDWLEEAPAARAPRPTRPSRLQFGA